MKRNGNDDPADLFTSVPQEDTGEVPREKLLGDYGGRARLVRIGEDEFRKLRASNFSNGASRIGLNLFRNMEDEGTVIRDGSNIKPDPADTVGLLDAAETDDAGTTWFGHVEGDPDSNLTIGDNAGIFSLTLESSLYGLFSTELFSEPAGIYVLRQLDPELIPDCGVDENDPDDKSDPDKEADQDDGGSHSAREDDGTVFDLMVVYTAPVKQALGGEKGVESLIRDSVRAGNRVLSNSGLTPRLNLVHHQELPNYTESGDVAGYYTMLAQLEAGRADGLEDLHELRDQWRADIVTLLVVNPDLGGLANVPPRDPNTRWGRRAYNVVNYRVAALTMTLFHEVAHNCGCCHETGCRHAPTWARGHTFTVGQRNLKSVMVRKSVRGTRVPFLSNPQVLYPNSDIPTGTDQRNNARVVRENARIIANFRMRQTFTSDATS